VSQYDDEFDDDARWEAAQEAAAEEHHEKIGREWARENAAELAKEFFEDNYEEAVRVFTTERLQSYYVQHPELAVPASNALGYAQSLMPAYPQAALVFAVSATEITIKDVFLRPIVSGLVHSEDLASFIADFSTSQVGINRYHKLLTEVLSQFGGLNLGTFKRSGANKTLWQEVSETQETRNKAVHRGEIADFATAALSVEVAGTLLNQVFPDILKEFDLHLHSPMTICGKAHPAEQTPVA
jgi:hypothetical protein